VVAEVSVNPYRLAAAALTVTTVTAALAAVGTYAFRGLSDDAIRSLRRRVSPSGNTGDALAKAVLWPVLPLVSWIGKEIAPSIDEAVEYLEKALMFDRIYDWEGE